MRLFRRHRRRLRGAARSRPTLTRSILCVEALEDRLAPASLNAVIDGILAARYASDPQSFPATFNDHVASATVGSTLNGGHDLSITGVDLGFSNVTGQPGAWTGNVTVSATSGVLLDGLLNIPLVDGDDPDSYAVSGVVNLATGTAATLSFDGIDSSQIGIPSFLVVQFPDIGMHFANFRGDESTNTLDMHVEFKGIDTGSDALNQLMASDNPLFQLTLEGTVSASLNLTSIESTVTNSGASDKAGKFRDELLVGMATNLDGVGINVSGKVFHVGDLTGTALYHTVSVDPDGNGPLPEQTHGYIAIQGGFRFANEELGGRGPKFNIAFAVSDLGPLSFYISRSPSDPAPDKVPEKGGINIEEAHFGVIFNKTIEQLQSGIDYNVTAASVAAAQGGGFNVTLTIPNNDLETGDTFAIVAAPAASSYVGEYTVVSVNGSQVSVHMGSNPGPFAGSGDVIRRTIKDPLDLRDDGLRTGIAVPGSITDWQNSLDASVRGLILAGDDIWAQMFENVVIGGGATVSLEEIPDTVLQFTVDVLLDTNLHILLNGDMIVADGTVQVPVSAYADLKKVDEGTGRFLFLADVGQTAILDDPLMVVRGQVSFEPITNGFQINVEGGVDVNVPSVTTITLEGTASLAFLAPATGPELQIDLGFDAELSATPIGDIAAATGSLHVSIDVMANDPTQITEVWGAALLTTKLGFLEDVGLFTSASAVLRINSSDTAKPDEVLQDSMGHEHSVALPAGSYALRFDGNADFRIDSNNNGTFAVDESVALLTGTFVLEFSPNGFNVALFAVQNGNIVPASIDIGPSSGRFLHFGVQGFLAIRSGGIAADMVLTVNADLPLGLATLDADAVWVVNTTGSAVTFNIPAGVDPDRPLGVSLTIPKAAPLSPEKILKAPGPGVTDFGLNALISGSPSWTEGSAGPYGVVFLAGQADLLSTLSFDVSGYFLLSPDDVRFNASFYAGADFLNLASASVSGSLFFSSEGEFQLTAHGDVQLGPDCYNLNGTADLTISYLDLDAPGGTRSTDPHGFGPKTLAVTGNLSVGAEVFCVDAGDLTLGVNYSDPNITVSITVPVPDIAWTDPDPVFGVSWPYPTIVNKSYSFTVGTLTVGAVQPPPIYLATRDSTTGVLTLNVGPNAAARNYQPSVIDEVVSVASAGAGSLSGQKIEVTMFGITQTFDNVASVSADMGDGNDILEIDNGVTVPVVAHMGDGADTLTDESADNSVTVYGEGGRDHLTGGSGTDHLYGGDDSDTIDGGAGADVIEGGAGNDFLIGGDGADTINGDDGQDLIAGDLATVTGSVSGVVFSSQASASGGSDTIHGGTGNDIAFGGSAGDMIYGDAGNDTLLGGDGQATIGSTISVVSLSLGSDGADTFFWKTGEGNDTIDGQSASDTLNVDATAGASTGALTSSQLTGLGMSTGISYTGLETINISLSDAADTFNVNSTSSIATTTINTGKGMDSVNVGSAAPSTSGNLNGIAGALVVNGGADSDTLNLYDTSDNAGNTGTLTSTKITGLGMGSSGITYSGVESLNINLGSGGDTFTVQSTASGTATTLNTGAGDDHVTVQVGGLASTALAINTQDDDDVITVNLANPSVNATINIDGGAPSASDAVIVNGTASSDSLTVDGLSVTSGLTSIQLTAAESLTANLLGNADSFIVNSTSIPTLLNGGDGADTYLINLGNLAAAVSVADSGASGSDALNINGIAGANNIVLDHSTLTRGTELVNYTGLESLEIDTHDAADTFMILDNGAVTTINSGKGDDEFTIGPAVNEDGEVIDANGNGTNADELAIKGTSFTMTINGGDGNDDFEVNRNTGELFLNGENGDDTFVLNTLITGGDSMVEGGVGADSITYLVNAPVHINGGDGFDTIIVNGSKLDDVFIITGTTVEVVGSRLVDYIGIESLQVNGRKGNDTFTVDTTIDGAGNPLLSTGLQLLAVNGQQGDDVVELRGMLATINATFSGGAGNDTFNLRSLAPVVVNAIDGPVTINGDEDQDTLNVYDTGDTTANTGTLTSTKLTGLGMASGVTYGTLEAVSISLGSGGNTFAIQDTHTGSTTLNSGSGDDTVNVQAVHGMTTVNTQAGHDTINVGSLAPAVGGTVNQIAAALIVNGGDGNPDTLNVDDTGDAAANSGVLTATTLTGLGMGTGITYGTVEVLKISLGGGGDNFNVQATAAGTATTLNSGAGDDVLTIDSNGALPNGTVDGVVSSLTINGQGGFNVLTMEDSSDSTGDRVHVTPTQVGAAAGDTFFGPGGFLTYSKLDQVTMNMSQAYSPDTIYLTPSTATQFFIRGGDPHAPMHRDQLPGDALYLDFTGLTAAQRQGVHLNATGVNDPPDPVFNVWTIPGYGNVNYKQIEKMNHVQTLALAADLGGNQPQVKVIDAETGLQKLSFLAFDPGYKGGVRVAVGDVNGDAIPDIITSRGPGGGPEVRVFNGATGVQFSEPIGDFMAFPPGSKTSVFVAVGDINQDGLADIVTGSDSGGQPSVKVYDAYKLLTGQANPVISQFFAYDKSFAGGVRLAVGDLTGDGVPDIAAAPASGVNGQVRIFKTNLSADQTTVTNSLLTSFNAFPKYNGPVHISVGDVTGDGRADIVVGTDSGRNAVRVYNGATLSASSPPALVTEFAPFGSQSGGARVALVDLDGDGVNELITASALIGSKSKPKAFDFISDGHGGLMPASIDAYFASYASDPFFQGAVFLGGGN
jgi:Ca2+-binding RTX toxin-like protein